MLGNAVLTGAKARRERVRQEMRVAIVEAAERIVSEHGIEGLTIRAVAQVLGYSPGALYEYFDSKELILCSLYFEGTDGLGIHCEQAVDQLPESSTAIDAMAALGRAYREFALDHAELYRLVFCGLKTPPEPPPVASPEDNPGGFGITVQVMRQGITDGLFVDMPPPMLATAAWAAVHGFVSLEIGGQINGSDGPGMPIPPPDEARRRRDEAFEVVLRTVLFGIAREEHRPPTII